MSTKFHNYQYLKAFEAVNKSLQSLGYFHIMEQQNKFRFIEADGAMRRMLVFISTIDEVNALTKKISNLSAEAQKQMREPWIAILHNDESEENYVEWLEPMDLIED